MTGRLPRGSFGTRPRPLLLRHRLRDETTYTDSKPRGLPEAGARGAVGHSCLAGRNCLRFQVGSV